MTEAVRDHFPALQRTHNGRPVAYFDAPGGTQVPRGVAEAMSDYLFHHNANTHWAYPTSEETDAIIAGARVAAGEFLNCQSEELFVDAVHLAPHEPIDVQAIGCDFLACSAYKFYGPHIGILFARRELLDSLPFPKLDPAPDTSPERAETGTQNQEGIAGVTATVAFMKRLGYDRLHREGQRFTKMLWDGLSSMRR